MVTGKQLCTPEQVLLKSEALPEVVMMLAASRSRFSMAVRKPPATAPSNSISSAASRAKRSNATPARSPAAQPMPIVLEGYLREGKVNEDPFGE